MPEQPTLAARGAITRWMIEPEALANHAVAVSISSARSGVRGPAPHRGEHNSEVLEDWLGKSAAQVKALHGSGVLQFDDEFVQL